MKISDKILYELLISNAVHRRGIVISDMDHSSNSVYNAVRSCINDGLIRERNIHYTYRRRKYDDTYLVLTVEGLRYILTNEDIKDAHPWIEDIRIPDGLLSIMTNKRTSDAYGRSIQRYVHISTAAIMARALGAKTGPIYYGAMDYNGFEEAVLNNEDTSRFMREQVFNTMIDYDDLDEDSVPQAAAIGNVKVTALSDAVFKAYVANRKSIEAERLYKIAHDNEGSGRDYRFLNATEIKNMAIRGAGLSEGEDSKDIIDIRAGRLSGIMTNSRKAVIVFSEPPYGMSWNERNRITDFAAYRYYVRHVLKNVSDRSLMMPEAMLLVKNKEELHRNFYDYYKIRTGENSVELGYGLNHFYVVPVDRNGVRQMKRIMECEYEEAENEIVSRCLDNGFIKPPTHIKGSGNLFALYDPDDNSYVVVGPMMDILKMNRIADVYKNNPDITIKVFCYQWQEEYYRHLFPRIVTIPSENE